MSGYVSCQCRDCMEIAIAGDSRGGYLAAAVALEAKLENTPQPVLQILIYPMTDMAGLPPSRVEEKMFLDDRTLQWVIGMHAGDNRLDPRASPIHAKDHSGLAPAIVIAASIETRCVTKGGPMRRSCNTLACRPPHKGG